MAGEDEWSIKWKRKWLAHKKGNGVSLSGVPPTHRSHETRVSFFGDTDSDTFIACTVYTTAYCTYIVYILPYMGPAALICFILWYSYVP